MYRGSIVDQQWMYSGFIVLQEWIYNDMDFMDWEPWI